MKIVDDKRKIFLAHKKEHEDTTLLLLVYILKMFIYALDVVHLCLRDCQY